MRGKFNKVIVGALALAMTSTLLFGCSAKKDDDYARAIGFFSLSRYDTV